MAKRFRIGLPLSAPLMILAIVGIASFQVYWMRKLYVEEWTQLKKETDIAFRDVVYKLQMQRFRGDTAFLKHDLPPSLFALDLMDSMRKRFVDSAGLIPPFPDNHTVTFTFQTDDNRDSVGTRIQGRMITGDSSVTHLVKVYSTRHSSGSPLSVKQIDSAYRAELMKTHITVPFRIDSVQGELADLNNPSPADKLQTNIVFVGLSKTYAYRASFGSPVRYILGRMGWPMALGLLLLGLTASAFVALYRNLHQQRRLGQFKNDFISNMTHELKTPISTIKVAVEALRHFDALDDPRRTREYLDISALELQRLSLLVDKVLKLSQFENRVMEFRLTTFDLRELAAEVIAEMRLPFEKAGAVVQITGPQGGGPEGARVSGAEGAEDRLEGRAEGRFEVRADRSHLSSVILNLLDNALKYSREGPVITVDVVKEDGMVSLSVTDNGIGIPAVYLGRVFDKFFRVPSDDHHNIKGHGLGLNYVQHIVQAHRGIVTVESKEGKGSTFTIKFRAA
jgi:two-component system, OmpR family, phosphate regulon sensor histidine kinase PhoR